MKLQHEDKENSASQVTVHYDNKIINLPVDENGVVEVENNLQAQELQTSHGKFFPLNEDEENDLPSYVLEDKNVDEVEKYVRDITSVDRLKELRKLESDGKNRATAIEHIDNRLGQVQNQGEQSGQDEDSGQEDEDEYEEDDEVSENNEEEGEETGDEEQ